MFKLNWFHDQNFTVTNVYKSAYNMRPVLSTEMQDIGYRIRLGCATYSTFTKCRGGFECVFGLYSD